MIRQEGLCATAEMGQHRGSRRSGHWGPRPRRPHPAPARAWRRLGRSTEADAGPAAFAVMSTCSRPPLWPPRGLSRELGLMEQPNQEEVRSQGSEVVHFIDQVLSTSYCLPAKPDPGLCGHPTR